jgi:hypothetical protein
VTSDPYSRVYHRIQDEYPNVFDDELALGTWLRLLVLAEGSYPAQPHLPRKVKAKPLALLVESGLITLLPADRYAVKGLREERERRSAAGRKGGLASSERRTVVERSLNDRPTLVGPRRDETRLDKTSKDETRGKNGLKPIGELLPGVIERLS